MNRKLNKTCFLRTTLLSLCYKRIGSCFSCTSIELWIHLGRLEGIQEARVALVLATPQATLTSRALQLPAYTVTRYTHAKHEPVLK